MKGLGQEIDHQPHLGRKMPPAGIEREDYRIGAIPAGRFGESAEIADAVVHLASDESRYTVGSELIIDGGMSNL